MISSPQAQTASACEQHHIAKTLRAEDTGTADSWVGRKCQRLALDYMKT